MISSRNVHVSLSIHYTGVGFTSAAIALAQSLPSAYKPIIYVPQVTESLPANVRLVRQLPFSLPGAIAYRPFVESWVRRRNEKNLLRAVREEGPGALVWIWPGASLKLQRNLKESGAVIIREMINTHAGTARRILDAEYNSLGLNQPNRITQEDELAEKEELALADIVVSPSESVDASLIEWGVPERHILRTTFGWKPTDFLGQSTVDCGTDGVKALFVGTVGVRKGIHLALAAWDRANLNGTFFVIGPIDPEAEPLIAPYRGRNDVRFIPFTRDLGSWYRTADFMFFPTLEEGAPLVCYQAGGNGLPILTSPMGRGRLVKDRETGFIVDPHDQAALIDRLRLLSTDVNLRQIFRHKIREKALTLDWTTAAEQRARAFNERRS